MRRRAATADAALATNATRTRALARGLIELAEGRTAEAWRQWALGVRADGRGCGGLSELLAASARLGAWQQAEAPFGRAWKRHKRDAVGALDRAALAVRERLGGASATIATLAETLRMELRAIVGASIADAEAPLRREREAQQRAIQRITERLGSSEFARRTEERAVERAEWAARQQLHRRTEEAAAREAAKAAAREAAQEEEGGHAREGKTRAAAAAAAHGAPRRRSDGSSADWRSPPWARAGEQPPWARAAEANAGPAEDARAEAPRRRRRRHGAEPESHAERGRGRRSSASSESAARSTAPDAAAAGEPAAAREGEAPSDRAWGPSSWWSQSRANPSRWAREARRAKSERVGSPQRVDGQRAHHAATATPGKPERRPDDANENASGNRKASCQSTKAHGGVAAPPASATKHREGPTLGAATEAAAAAQELVRQRETEARERAHRDKVETEQSAALRRILQTAANDARGILNLPKRSVSSVGEITRAFRQQSLLVHPDKNRAPDAEEAFKKVHAAYVALKDEVARGGARSWEPPPPPSRTHDAPATRRHGAAAPTPDWCDGTGWREEASSRHRPKDYTGRHHGEHARTAGGKSASRAGASYSYQQSWQYG